MESKARKLMYHLERQAGRGFRGYPTGTVAFYGPDNTRASKVTVGIVLEEDAEPEYMKKWFSKVGDVRDDAETLQAVSDFLEEHSVLSMAMTPALYGCPHEEGIDYPEGKVCPQCPYWAKRDRDEIFRQR